MKDIKLIIGLANPIDDYNGTRHNVGAWFVYELANKYHIILKKNKKRPSFFIGKLYLTNKCIFLFVSNEFMNSSGETILFISNFYSIPLHHMLIVHDELDLLPGFIKLKYGYGHNGHNGIRNIINILGNNNFFLRIQVGIGRPKNISEISHFVLSKPTYKEKISIRESIFNAINKICLMLERNDYCKNSLFLSKER